MKNLISLSILFALVLLMISSCNKTVEEKLVYNTNTLIDTVFLHDTIQNYDTLFIYDSIIYTDTIVIIDTVIVQDTSEFAYLFKHYELGTYDILFYEIDKQKNSSRICTMKSDEKEIYKHGEGHYPIWAEDGDHVLYIDFSNWSLRVKDIRDDSLEDSTICGIDREVMFLRHHVQNEVLIFCYRNGAGLPQLGVLDYHTGNITELSDGTASEASPACSDVDDWIYFSTRINETSDVYRRKIDGSQMEAVYIDPEFDLSSFSISSDGKFLITPKYRDGKGIVVFYDIENHRIIRELELPVDGHPIYTVLSRDHKALFFVNGLPNNSSMPRNLYRMALDKSQLFQMTDYEEYLANRPLVY